MTCLSSAKWPRGRGRDWHLLSCCKLNTIPSIYPNLHFMFLPPIYPYRANPDAQPHAKAIQVVEKLDAALCTRYFTCSQIVILLEYFPQGKLWKYTNAAEAFNFSNFRIDLLISLLSRITDLQNLNVSWCMWWVYEWVYMWDVCSPILAALYT